MPSSQIERKLAAIMFTDIAGYTALSAKDSTKASKLLKTQRDILKPIVEKHGGSWMKEMGDGLLLTFDSATSAVECSIAIQEATKDIEDLNLRIGIHEGEVIKQDGDVIGDDVNVASRIEPFSAVGGVAISHKIEQAISSNTEFETKYIGKPKLKGVAQKVEVYCITSHGLPETDVSKVSAKLEQESKFNIFALTGGILTAIGVAFWIAVGVFDVSFGGKAEVPSVGILMMENLGKEDEEFWSSGMTADLITKVAGAGLIRVVPLKEIRNIDSNLSIEEIAKKLRVKYILTHSFLIKDDGFDLWCKLENTENGIALFSNKISEPMDMTTQMVGKLANDIVTSLKVKTKQDVMKAPTSNVEAYEFYLKGKHKYNKRENTDDTEIARGLLNKAIEFDNNLIFAKLLLGRTYVEMGNYDKAMEFLTPSLKQSEELDDKKGIGASLHVIGSVHYNKGDNDKALDYYERSLAIREEIGDKRGIRAILNSIGNVHKNKGDNDKALDYYERSLARCEELGDKHGIRAILNNIGSIYWHEGDFDKALDYSNKALAICEEIGDKRGMGTILHGIGVVHADKGDFDIVLDYFERSLAIREELGDKRGMGYSLNSIGAVYYGNKGDFDKALDYYDKALAIREEIGDKIGMGYSLHGIGQVHADKGDNDKALDYYERSLAIYEETGEKYGMGYSLNNIGTVYYDKGSYEKAEEYYERALGIQKEIGLGGNLPLWTNTYLYLTYKHIGKQYDEKEIHSLIKETENIEFELNLKLYELLENKSYLESAYNQVQEKASAMDEELAAKFLELKIPKAIVKEWEKVNP